MSGSWADDLARAGESAWAAKGEPATVREGADTIAAVIARDALLSLAAALDRKAAEQHAEAKAVQRLGREAEARTITAIARTYEVSAAMARRRAESGPAPADEAAPVSREGQEPPGESEAPQRVALGRLVRAVWVAWAREQPAAKPSWLAGWADLDDGQREVDMRIGEAVAAAERERLGQLADNIGARYLDGGDWSRAPRFSDAIRRFSP